MAAGSPSVAWFDGRVVPFREARLPIEDRAVQFGEGLYEVIAVCAGAPRLVEQHVERMRHGATLLGLADAVPPAEEWARIAAELVRRDRVEHGLFYAQLTGGEHARMHLPTEPTRPCFFAYARPFAFPDADAVRRGIGAITCRDTRWARCDLKTTMLLPSVLARRAAREAGAVEAIFLDADGKVREGAASNVVLLEGRRLITPRESEHQLPGITRPLLGELAETLGLSMHDDEVTVGRLLAAREVLVTSTTFLVMPVVHIDGRAVGEGVAGPVGAGLARLVRTHLGLEA